MLAEILDYARDTESFDASPRLNSRFDIVEEFPRERRGFGIGALATLAVFA